MSQKLKFQIKDVWAENLVEEMVTLRKLVEKYPYIAMVCPPPAAPSLSSSCWCWWCWWWGVFNVGLNGSFLFFGNF